MSGKIITSGLDRMPRVPLYKPNATLTGKTRPRDYEALKELVKMKYLTRTEFNDEITVLDIAQAKVDVRRQARQAAALKAKTVIRATEEERVANLARVQARQQAMTRLASETFAKGASVDEEGWVFAGKLVRLANQAVSIVVRTKRTGAQLNVNMTLRDTKATIHNQLRKLIFIQQGSGEELSVFKVDAIGNPLPAGDTITIDVLPQAQPVMAIRLEGQKFRDSATEHCVCAPLERMWEEYVENCESPASRKKMEKVLECIRGFAAEYPDGIPEGDAMEELAKALNRKIVIKLLLSSDSQVYNAKCVKGVLIFHNVRENHVEFGGKARSHTTLTSNPIIVPQEELSAIVADHIRRDEFVLFSGMEGKERRVYSANGAWAVEDKKAEIMEAHEKVNNLKDIGVNARTHPELNEYLRDGRHNVGQPIKLAEGEPEAEVDMSKAYTQAEASKYFRGYAGMVWGYGRLPEMSNEEAKKYLEDTIGYFTIRIEHNPDAVSSLLGLTAGKTLTLFSPMVLYIMAHGATVKLLSCVICNRIDTLEYSADMLNSKAYAKWAGRLSYDVEDTEFNCTATRRFAEHLKANGYNVKWRWINGKGDDAQGVATVLVPRQHRMTRHQVFGSICAYTQMNVMEAIRCFHAEDRLDDVKYATLDSILYSGELAAGVSSMFRKKGEWLLPPFADPMEEALGKHLHTNDWYDCLPSSDAWMELLENPRSSPLQGSGEQGGLSHQRCVGPRVLTPTVLTGQGGCGKTYWAMTANIFHNAIYVSPLTKLCDDVDSKYGMRAKTIHQLLGMGCLPLFMQENAHPPMLLVDELSMMPKHWIEKLIKMYPRTHIVLAGDVAVRNGQMIAYQCRNGTPGKFDELFDAGSWNQMNFTTDRRALDEPLKEMKLAVRKVMDEIRTDGEKDDAIELAGVIRDMYPTMNQADAVKIFQKGDIWIAGTHKKNEELLELGVFSGYAKDKATGKEVARASFTTHSIQGQTVETGRVFVSIYDCFELAMLYTAISRVRRWDQVVLVR